MFTGQSLSNTKTSLTVLAECLVTWCKLVLTWLHPNSQNGMIGRFNTCKPGLQSACSHTDVCMDWSATLKCEGPANSARSSAFHVYDARQAAGAFQNFRMLAPRCSFNYQPPLERDSNWLWQHCSMGNASRTLGQGATRPRLLRTNTPHMYS